MRIIDKTELSAFKNIFLSKLRSGSLFIYPTDTIYGIGCDARNGAAIDVIRNLKQRPDQPFSVLVPSKEWIYENCLVPEHAKPWIDKLPGPYTLVFELKNKQALHSSFNNQDSTIGVRIPNHWISTWVADYGGPIITTSPNKHGEEMMKHPDMLDVSFHPHVDFLIFEGVLHNPPSTVVKLTDVEPQFLRGQLTR